MKYGLHALRLIVVGLVALAPAPAVAQTTANGPYYAIPSWDQKLQCDTLSTCPRFIVLLNWGSNAVLDRETGLVWERSPTEFLAWDRAQFHCNNLIVGNRKGWRLPTLQELMSLVDPSVPPLGTALPAGHPFTDVVGNVYWSATTNVGASDHAWGVDFQRSGNEFVTSKAGGAYVWCVRGGQGVDPQ